MVEVLDLGCGVGSFCKEVALKLPHSKITGLDVSPQAIKSANRSKLSENVSFVHADFDNWDPPGLYRWVVAINSLQYSSSLSILINKIFSWMPEGGYFFIKIPNEKNCLPFKRALDDTKKRYRHFINFLKIQIIAILEQNT